MNRIYPMSPTYPGIPTPKAIQLAILEHVADRIEYGFGQIYANMVDHFGLSPELEGMTFRYAGGENQLPASGKNVFYKYCNGACRELERKDWLEDVGGGGVYEDKIYRITDQGLAKVGQEAVAKDRAVPPEPCAVPPEQEHSHFVVILGDGRTRIARKYAVDVFADVIAILGLKRVAEIYPRMVTRERQSTVVERQRGDYYVCFYDGSTVGMGNRLRMLASELGADLTVRY